MGTASHDAATVRVLVVEDDENNRLVVSRLLRLAGVSDDRIFTADGDASGYLASGAAKVDLVLLDLQLPGKDGYAVLGELRSDPATRDLMVVALTANVMRQDVERCREAGFDGFIGKPIDGRRFRETFARILEGEGVWTVF
jgi:two-component system cell cycle response regulator DivK